MNTTTSSLASKDLDERREAWKNLSVDILRSFILEYAERGDQPLGQSSEEEIRAEGEDLMQRIKSTAYQFDTSETRAFRDRELIESFRNLKERLLGVRRKPKI